MDALTERQAQFVEEYLLDLNAQAAAIRAGYAPSCADSMGSFLLHRHGPTRAAIAIRRTVRTQRARMNADRVVEELERIAGHDARTLFRPDGTLKEPHEWDDATAAAVSGIKVKRTSTSALGFANSSGAGGGAGASTVQITEDTIELKRWDKVKSLELLARHHGVVRDGSTPQGTGRSLPPIDPQRIARMSDEELDQALALSDRLLPP